MSVPEANNGGFTLIELSIVLVIIGLIVGGVLTGQDLIKAAEIRATIGQLEKYNTAVNTFRTKYNGIPGDLIAASAASFNMIARAGSAGRGDGNGVIDSFGGTNTTMVYGQENGLFWADLSTAGFLDGNFTYTDSAAPTAVAAAAVVTTFPLARMGRGNYITVGSVGGLNYFEIAGITGVTVTTGSYGVAMHITPMEAYNMDKKVDDGMPLAGSVQAQGLASAADTTLFTEGSAWHSTTAAGATAGDCVWGPSAASTANAYETYGSFGTMQACALRFRFN